MIQEVEVVEKPPANPLIPVPMIIRKNTWETDDTFTLHLEPIRRNGNNTEFRFRPGQFNMLQLPGIGESAISISSDPSKPSSISHTIHRVGSVTKVLSHLKRGATIGVRGPFGSSWPVEKAKGFDVCVAAGGIGLAPLRPVLYSMFHRRKDYGRIILLYGARSPLNLLYRVELEQWSKLFQVEVLVTVDRGDSTWKGHIGVVSNLLSYVELDKSATVAMICGPEIMMQFTAKAILERGLSPRNVYLSLERNMKCAVGFCGHCQYGPFFICKDGPVFSYQQISHLFEKKEI